MNQDGCIFKQLIFDAPRACRLTYSFLEMGDVPAQKQTDVYHSQNNRGATDIVGLLKGKAERQ